jgi:6-phosphogluconolactonase
MAAPQLLETFSESFMDAEQVFFQIMRFGEATYLWMGHAEARQDVLAYGVPGAANQARPASGTSLIGGQSGDSASETMAKRLAHKLGHPVFVSISIRDDVELRAWAERQALMALIKGRGGAAPPAGLADVSDGAAAAPAGARTYEVFEEGDSKLGETTAAMLLSAAREAIAARGKFVLALSGGSIPKLLAPTLLAAAKDARFDAWHVFLADERYVAIDHADSNMGEWKARFLDQSGVPPSQIYPLDIALSLADAAKAYEAQLRSVCGGGDAASGGDPPTVDVLVLGMGPDGHTASLFEGHPLVEEAGCWVAPISDSPKPPPCRITLTLPCLNASRLALFVVTGGSKAPNVRRAFSPEPGVPAGMVLATQRTHWLLDAPAAAELLQEEAKQSAMYS